MNYLFFDLETTGLARTSNILEFGGVLCDEKLNPIKLINEYFLTYEPVPQSAINIHGLTPQRLEFLSNRDFISAAPDIIKLVSDKDTCLCGHNIIGYDLPVLASNLSRAGFDFSYEDRQCIDTLKLAKEKMSGSHKLEVVINTLLQARKMKIREVNDCFDSIVSENGLTIDSEMRYHNALYDSFLSWCVYIQLT